MSRRLVTLTIAAALAVAGAAAASSSTPGAAAGCAPPGSHVLSSSEAGQAYSLHKVVYGCSDRTGLSTRLGRAEQCVGTQRAGPVIVAGELVAYGLETCGVDTGSTSVVVLRLSDGKQQTSDAATTLPVLLPESYENVDSLFLKPDGAVAWIAVRSSITGHGGTDVEVHKVDRHGQRLLDSGSSIHPYSLRLQGSKLTWKHGHKTRSAALS
jgi:hypothetical protein